MRNILGYGVAIRIILCINNVPEGSSQRQSFVVPGFHNSFTATKLKDSYPFAFNQVASTFTSLHLKHTNVESVTRYWKNPQGRGDITTRLTNPLDIVLEIYDDKETSFRKMVNLAPPLVQALQQLQPENVHLKVVEFVVNWEGGNPNKFKKDITTQEIARLVGNVKVGCLIWVMEWRNKEELANNTKRHCGSLFDKASHFTWYLHGSFITTFTPKTYIDQVEPRLNKLKEGRDELLKLKPDATVALKFYHETHYWRQFVRVTDRISRNFYCNEKLLDMNQHFAKVLNWGRAHNFPILWKEAFAADDDFGWWIQVEPGKEISNEIATVFPKFVMRNHPDNMMHMKTDPCIVWSSESPAEGIQFDRSYTGAYLDMGVKSQPLRVEELQSILLFSLKKFSFLEILIGHTSPQSTVSELETVEKAMTPSFVEMLQQNGIGKRALYLQVPDPREDDQHSAIMGQIQELAGTMQFMKEHIVLEGIHVSNWGEDSSAENLLLSSLVQLHINHYHDLKVGLSVRNCSALLNSLPKSQHLERNYLAKVNYIICDGRPIGAENSQAEFARFMDSQLYLSSAFSHFDFTFDVHFRLNSYPCCGNDEENTKTGKMLRFLNDVNQFASGNKMKYFLIATLSQTSNSTSLWQVSNNADLSVTSNYVDNEAHFYKEETWRPQTNRNMSHAKSGNVDVQIGTESSNLTVINSTQDPTLLQATTSKSEIPRTTSEVPPTTSEIPSSTTSKISRSRDSRNENDTEAGPEIATVSSASLEESSDNVRSRSWNWVYYTTGALSGVLLLTLLSVITVRYVQRSQGSQPESQTRAHDEYDLHDYFTLRDESLTSDFRERLGITNQNFSDAN